MAEVKIERNGWTPETRAQRLLTKILRRFPFGRVEFENNKGELEWVTVTLKLRPDEADRMFEGDF